MAGPDPEQAVAAGKARREEYSGVDYVRYTEGVKDIPRGTAAFGDRLVYGYPHIGRILALEPGLAQQFDGPFRVEEKIDGFNVRVFRLDGELVALSRGGFVCPFSTDRAAEFIDPGLFEDHPDLVVCAEVAGPDNPYIEGHPPFVTRDVRFFVFDLMRASAPGFLPAAELDALTRRYRLPRVEAFGRHAPADAGAIGEIVTRLDAEGREGVVLKSDPPATRRAKYVTANSGIQDIRATARSIMDLPAEYFTNRILRLVLFRDEHALGQSPEFDCRLGAAFLEGLYEAIQQFRAEHRVYRTFRCRFRERINAERMMDHLGRVASRQVAIAQRDLRRDGDRWLLEFDRVYPTMNGLLGHLLGGGLVYD